MTGPGPGVWAKPRAGNPSAVAAAAMRRTSRRFMMAPGVAPFRAYGPPNALKVMMVWVSWMPGMTCTFSLMKWPMSVSLST